MAFKLFTFLFFVLTSIALTCSRENKYSKFTSQRRSIISKNHALKTIKVINGDIIDCVDMYKQPAFDHPALRNHTIQLKPTFASKTDSATTKMETSEVSSSKVASQVWQQYGSCPKGTIPIRRMINAHQANRSTITHQRKLMQRSVKHNHTNEVLTPQHSFAVVLTEGFSYSGAQAEIKVYNPFVESIGDYSSSQVMVRNGPLKGFETVEAGWAVNPIVYNDQKTRLFVYWTVDASQNTGCFDLTCPGFVQTNREIVLGADITDLYGSFITIRIRMDPYKRNWWMLYNNKEVGYFPGELFGPLRTQGNLVQWGGEVFSPKVGTKPHTTTAMGSGRWSDPILGGSGVIKGLRIEENSIPLKLPENLFATSDEEGCYDAFLVQESVPEPVFYYGGPGSRNNPRC